MAHFEITTTPEEQAKVLEVLRNLQGNTVSVSKVASIATLPQSRVRYVLTDLVDAGKVCKVPTKAFNARYIRYRYDVM